MALTEEQLKAELESYLKKLAGVMPIGYYWFGIDPKSKPAGVQIYSGQLLSRSAYQKHWEFVSGGHRTILKETEWQSMVEEQGFCPYFSDGDGSTTYRMPLVKGVHPKFVSALLEAGGYTEAGLPNITGLAGIQNLGGCGFMPAMDDAFVSGGTSNYAIQNPITSGYTTHKLKLDASRSNPIYGNSDTVQPEAISILIGEYVIGTIAEIGEANAESLLASVTQLEAGKLDKTGGGISGNLSVSGDLFVGGQINASISGTSENAVKASQDAQGRVIDETYATKSEVSALETVLPGFVMAFAANSNPQGYLLCNGAAVSRTTYAKLYEAIGTTYGTGDGATTFNLPDTTGRMIQGEWPYNPVGTYKNAGLPQASGSVRYLGDAVETSGIAAGAISLGPAELGAGGSIAYWQRVPLNLSNGNAVYGASDTVQPPAVTMRYYIKY